MVKEMTTDIKYYSILLSHKYILIICTFLNWENIFEQLQEHNKYKEKVNCVNI